MAYNFKLVGVSDRLIFLRLTNPISFFLIVTYFEMDFQNNNEF